MSRFNNDQLVELLNTIDIEYWLDREGIAYKRTRGKHGPQANVRECPCCGNDNWKVYVGLETGLGNCFSGDCEKRFNKWSFIRAYLGSLSNRDVVEHIRTVAQEQGWRPPKSAVAVNLNGALELPPSLILPIAGRNLKYLENRGIGVNVARYFSLRYCHNGAFFYYDEGRRKAQDYSKRVIIPVFDLTGDLVSFQGRDITGTSDRKYLFPPGFASTGAHFYNGQNAIGAEEVVIGEGAFDVFATKIALDADPALRNVIPIGSFGKHLSFGDETSQLAKLQTLKSTGLRRVTFMWDGEDTAIDAAIDAALKVRGIGLHARVAILPQGRDPNEVPPQVVRGAFWKAVEVNTHVAARLKLAKRVA